MTSMIGRNYYCKGWREQKWGSLILFCPNWNREEFEEGLEKGKEKGGKEEKKKSDKEF